MKQTARSHSAGHGRLRRLRPLPTVLVAALGVIGAASPSIAAPTADTSPTPAAAKSSSASTTQTVTLVTGDRVIVTTVGGQTHYTIDPAVPGDAAFQSYRDAQGDYHVIPALAQPFLGSTLNPALFDITAELRAHAQTGPKNDAKSDAVAEVSTQSSTRLVAALRQAIGADVRAGRRAGTTVPHLTGLPAAPRTAIAAAPATAAPGHPQRFLQVDVTDQSGHPANGTATLINTDSSLTFLYPVTINGGVDRVALPVGNYSILFDSETYDAQGDTTSGYVLTKTDFSVPATGTVPDVVLDGRTAVPVHVATPQAATAQLISVGWFRKDASARTAASAKAVVPDGGGGDPLGDPSIDFNYSATGNMPFAMNPQPAAKVGTLSSEVQWMGGDAKGTYRYDTAFTASDVPDISALKVTSAQLATEHHHYYTDPAAPKQGGVDEIPTDYANPLPVTMSALVPQSMPADVTEYLSVLPNAVWSQDAYDSANIEFVADPAVLKAGSTSSIDWGRGPLAPGVGRHTITPGANDASGYCQACLAGADLQLSFNDFNDSAPGQKGAAAFWPDASSAPQESTTMSGYQNGQLLGTTPNSSSFSISDAPAAGAQYKVVYDTSVTAPYLSESTSADTTLVFSTTPAAEAAAALTPLGSCTGQSPVTPCQVLPLLNLSTQLAVSESGTAAAGTETMGLSIGHVSYNGTGSHAAITSAGVQVSFDGGKTWQTADLAQTGAATAGSYTASWTNPAADTGSYPSIRITATDAVGGSISQTVNNAYEIVKGA